MLNLFQHLKTNKLKIIDIISMKSRNHSNLQVSKQMIVIPKYKGFLYQDKLKALRQAQCDKINNYEYRF